MDGLFGTTVMRTGSFEETCVPHHCEPYVMVTRIDLRHLWPEVEVFIYSSWNIIDPDDTAVIRPLVWRDGIWKLDVTTPPIGKLGDMIFLIALMEHIDGKPSTTRLMIKQAVIEALNASAYPTREAPIARLIDVINRAIDCANGGPNFGSPIEIILTTSNIIDLWTEGSCGFALSFCGYGGHYRLRLQLSKEESDLRNLVIREDEAFVCAAE